MSRAPEVWEPQSFRDFLRLCITGRQETSLAREGKKIWHLRTLFYGAAARLRFRTTKTHVGHWRPDFAAMQHAALSATWGTPRHGDAAGENRRKLHAFGGATSDQAFDGSVSPLRRWI